ncbi:hypothetical protein GCM10022377_21640 [Zhihengliuella alba]|uniref:Uncharacterized protein n=1 Tax=Zhihengliuella alba TaxID=547018 RepID=A0ABP7DSR8_9MICC
MDDRPSKQVNRFALQLDDSGSYDFVIDGVRLRGQIYGPDDATGADVTLLSVQHALT